MPSKKRSTLKRIADKDKTTIRLDGAMRKQIRAINGHAGLRSTSSAIRYSLAHVYAHVKGIG